MANIKRLNKLSRKRDQAKKNLRFTYLMVAVYVVWCIGVLALWGVAIDWAVSDMGVPGVDKGGAMFGIVVLLSGLSIASAFVSIPVGITAGNAWHAWDEANEAYLDELDNV